MLNNTEMNNVFIHSKKSNISSDNKQVILQSIDFLLKELLSSRMYRAIVLEVTITDDLFDTTQRYGDMYSELGRYDRPRMFRMRLNHSSNNIKQMLITLAHELTHLKQYARGELYETLKFKQKYNFRWHGEWMAAPEQEDERPWEIEAYTNERSLFDKLLCNVK